MYDVNQEGRYTNFFALIPKYKKIIGKPTRKQNMLCTMGYLKFKLLRINYVIKYSLKNIKSIF